MLDLLSFLSSMLGQQQQQSQFSSSLGQTEADRALRQKLAEQQLAQSGSQFDRTFGFDTNKFQKELELQKASQLLQQNQLLGNLGSSLKSPDILNLLGKNLGIAGLGSRTYNPFTTGGGGFGGPTSGNGLPVVKTGYVSGPTPGGLGMFSPPAQNTFTQPWWAQP